MTKINPAVANGSLATSNSVIKSSKQDQDYIAVTKTLSKVSYFAIPIVLAGIVINVPQAEAGPITYASCVAACEALATVSTGGPGAAFIMQCIQACYPALGPWCP